MGMTYKRPFDRKTEAAYLAALRAGWPRGVAAEAVRVHRRAVRDLYHKDPAFRAAVDRAECTAVEDALYRQALAGNPTAIRMWIFDRVLEH
jgi:hypothetical protein